MMALSVLAMADRLKLQARYQQLMKEAHQLSQRDRKAGDKKMAEAEEVMQKIEALQQAAK